MQFIRSTFGLIFLITVVLCSMPNRVTAAETEAGGAEWALFDSEFRELPSARLDDLVVEAMKKNPDIAAAQAEWKASQKRILQAWALPDPSAGFDIMGEHTETRVGPQEHRFVLSQKIPFPGKLWARRQAAKARAESMRNEYEAVKRNVLSLLERNYYDLYVIDSALRVIEEVYEILKSFENVAQSRYANHGGSQRDVAKAQAEVSMMLEQIYELHQKRRTVAARLVAILDRDPLSSIGPAEEPRVTEIKKTLPELIGMAAQNRESIEKSEALQREKKYRKTLAALENIPDAEIGFSYTWVGEGTTNSPQDGKDSWMIPLRFTVPLWQNRIMSGVQEKKYEQEAAEANVKGTSNEVFFQVKDAYYRYHTASRTAQLYETAVIPQAEIALSSDQAGYEGGEADFLSLLDSERVYLNAKLSLVRMRGNILAGYADLKRAVGVEPGGES